MNAADVAVIAIAAVAIVHAVADYRVRMRLAHRTTIVAPPKPPAAPRTPEPPKTPEPEKGADVVTMPEGRRSA